MTGTHVRFGAYPHGQLGATTTVDFAPDMFLRLQVLDYRDWFRKNPNPRNRLTRYTEGNLVTPLIDGAPFFRELYRIFRATYKDIDPTLPAEAFDPDAAVDDAPATGVARAKLVLSNAWIESANAAARPARAHRGTEDAGCRCRGSAAVRRADVEGAVDLGAGAAGAGGRRRGNRRSAQVVDGLGGERAAARRRD